MYDVKPIETKYKGYRFRSRLEARYAVFFDALGVKWEYEKEGYKLPHGCYLPDFWLPDWKAWFEVKPEGGATKQALDLAKDLCEKTGYGVLVSDGLPKLDFQGHAFFWSSPTGERGGDYVGGVCSNIAATLFNAENRLLETEKEAPNCKLKFLREEIKIAYADALFFLNSFCVRDFKYVFTTYPDGWDDDWCVIENFQAFTIFRPIQEEDLDFLDKFEEDYEIQIGDNWFSSPYCIELSAHRDGFFPYPGRNPFVHSDICDEDYVLGSIGKNKDYDDSFHARVVPAIEAAQSARFEHGETA